MNRFAALVARRVIQFSGNVLKLPGYISLLIFPRKRFTLPEHAAPLIRSSKPSTIPRTIWQTNYTAQVTLPVYLNHLFNRLMSPTFEYRFMVTEARASFVEENYPGEISEHYKKIQIGASQADFWRLLILQKYGGVYMDIDAHAVWPLGYVINPGDEELFVRSKHKRLTNYFIASKPNNPHLQAVIEHVLNNIKEASIDNVYNLTGPGALNQTLKLEMVNWQDYRYTCNQGSFTNEYFQYVDKPQGKWTKEQKNTSILTKEE